MRSSPGKKPVARFFGIITGRVRLWMLVLLVVGLAGPTGAFLSDIQNKDAVKVSLDERSPVAQLRQVNDPVPPEGEVLRVAIAGVLSPTSTLEHYQELLTFLGQRLGRRITLVLRPTYSEIYDLVKGKQVDVAFVCTLVYVKGNEDFGMELLVAPQMRGETVYYSYLIVPVDSSATSLSDLQNEDFAFTDPLSNTGYLVPIYNLYLLGEKPNSFFRKYTFTYSHDNSITAVADRLLDGAAVDSLVYEQMRVSKPQLITKTKIIARWGPYGIPPVTVNPTIDGRLKQQLRDTFLGLHESADGKAILSSLGIDRFVAVSDGNYESVRQMIRELGW